MSTTLERLTVTMPSEMTAAIKYAVEEGGYASASEVVREALRDWSTKRQLMLDDLAALKKDIDKGLADVAAGRVKQFNADDIINRGRQLLAARSS
ncbi:MAG: ribbon-helix-helix protein, CopG family [Azoarcus sp.]|jgi:antitoxin ParD1/3/4|nr:ribbon-helix-helix protein, CopG family [Azoarcus sp.]